MIDKALYEVTRILKKMRVAFELKHVRGPKGLKQSQPFRDLPAGAPVFGI